MNVSQPGADVHESGQATASGVGGRVGILVMGMHRAGTSLLARMLAALGCDPPRTPIGPSANNEAGYWESRPVRELNDRLLAAAGSRWDDWRGIALGWNASPEAEAFHHEAMALMEAEFGRSPLFVLKDPRVARLGPFWLGVLEALGTEPRVVLALRHPAEVAASLAARDGLAPDLSHLIWLRHMIDAEAASRGRRRVVADHDGMLRDWRGEATRIGQVLDLSWPRAPQEVDGEPLVRHDLHHHRQQPGEVDGERLPEWVHTTHAILGRWAAAGEDAADLPRLDAVRAALDAAEPAIGGLVARGSLARTEAELQALRAEHDQAGKRLTRSEAERKAQQQVIADLRRNAEAMMAELRAAEERHAATLADLSAKEADVETRLAEIARMSRLLHGVEEERRREAEAVADLRQEVVQASRLREELVAERAGRLHHADTVRILRALLNARGSGWRPGPLGLRRDMAAVRGTGLFDEGWYLRAYADVAAAGMDPLRHYVTHGIDEDRRPNPGPAPGQTPQEGKGNTGGGAGGSPP